MTGIEIGLAAIVLMCLAIYFGLHIGIALIAISFVCVSVLRDPAVAANMAAATANDTIQEYLFGVIPLFVLMGLLVAVSDVGKDAFDVAQWLLRRVRGGLGVATVASNAAFAAVTGISIASASIFTKVAVPEMLRYGYNPRFAVGVVAGSSILGMLIPPSLLFIIYGVLSEQSIGKLFTAGILPGIVMAVMFSLMIVAMAVWSPRRVRPVPAAGVQAQPEHHETLGSAFVKLVPLLALMALVLGGLYGGFVTPTEAGAVGAAGALVIALLRRKLDRAKIWRVLVETGHVSVSILFLIIAASLYSRMLAMSGMPQALSEWMAGAGLGPYGFLLLYILVVIALGCIIDSVSILLIMLPIAVPVATHFGMDLVWFGVVTIVAVEIGLITPPFGISVFTVKSALNDPRITVKDIFAGAFPFVLCMAATLGLLVMFPAISLALVRLM
jgi:C4-dicarboxylate transporter, DctM subunit